MFINLPGLVLVVLILSQISYLECSSNDVDSILPSFKESFFLIIFCATCVSTSGIPVILCSIVITGRYLLSCNYFNVFILST